MGSQKSAINWFEIPVADFERSVKFYSSIPDFDMPTRQMGDNQMGFFEHQQGEGIGGAIVHGDGYVPSYDGALVYLNAGDDLQDVLDRVEDAGGSIVQPKMEIGEDIGYLALFTDPDGNRVALHSMS